MCPQSPNANMASSYLPDCPSEAFDLPSEHPRVSNVSAAADAYPARYAGTAIFWLWSSAT